MEAEAITKLIAILRETLHCSKCRLVPSPNIKDIKGLVSSTILFLLEGQIINMLYKAEWFAQFKHLNLNAYFSQSRCFFFTKLLPRVPRVIPNPISKIGMRNNSIQSVVKLP